MKWATTCRERELTLNHIHTSLTTQGHGGPPRLKDQINAGATSETTEHERQYTTFTHPFILTRHTWKDDYDCQMIFGDLGHRATLYLSYRWWKNTENLTQETCPDRGANPGLLRDRRACYRLLHSGGPYLFLSWRNLIFHTMSSRLPESWKKYILQHVTSFYIYNINNRARECANMSSNTQYIAIHIRKVNMELAI